LESKGRSINIKNIEIWIGRAPEGSRMVEQEIGEIRWMGRSRKQNEDGMK
jgi:hypothetical protein